MLSITISAIYLTCYLLFIYVVDFVTLRYYGYTTSELRITTINNCLKLIDIVVSFYCLFERNWCWVLEVGASEDARVVPLLYPWAGGSLRCSVVGLARLWGLVFHPKPTTYLRSYDRILNWSDLILKWNASDSCSVGWNC